MSSTFLGSENVTSDGYLLKGHRHSRGSVQQQHISKLTPASDSRQVSSLAFLPILGLIIFVVCSFMKVYKWSKDDARWKARGDVEFGDEAEVNYGIIQVGDKDFCPIDIRSDGASVYDTVNSFRLLSNGYTCQFGDAYHDTVTSYKSLLMKGAEGSQYDSIKSYKSFLHKVAQNKDLAVQVKLLENYPVRSKSADPCVALEDEACRRSEAMVSKMHSALPLIEHLHREGQLSGKRKFKQGRNSGQVPTAARKRSLPNPGSDPVTSPAYSMPSICPTFSYPYNPTETTRRSFRTDRHKSWKNKQTVSHSSLGGGNLTKVSAIVAPSTGGRHICDSCKKRRRHYSADSLRRAQRTAGIVNQNHCKYINNEASANDYLKTVNEVKTITKIKPKFLVQRDESSSEIPNSSHSSGTDIPSDALTTESDHETKNKPLSTLSDGQTVDNGIFVSFNSAGELPHSLAVFHSSPKLPSSGTKMLLAQARSKFFSNKLNNAFSIISPDFLVSCPPSVFLSKNNCSDSPGKNIKPVNLVQISVHENHSISDQLRPGLGFTKEPSPTVFSRDSLNPINNQQQLVMANTLEVGEGLAKTPQSSLKDQHFHVTVVSAANICTHNPDCSPCTCRHNPD